MTKPTPEAIRKLVEQIEAGREIDWPATGLRPLLWTHAASAYHVSLDSAQKLHDALLSNKWRWEKWGSGEFGVLSSDSFIFRAYDPIPARAWLICILAAYAWKLKQEEGK